LTRLYYACIDDTVSSIFNYLKITGDSAKNRRLDRQLISETHVKVVDLTKLDEAERKGGKQLMKILAMGRCIHKFSFIIKDIFFNYILIRIS